MNALLITSTLMAYFMVTYLPSFSLFDPFTESFEGNCTRFGYAIQELLSDFQTHFFFFKHIPELICSYIVIFFTLCFAVTCELKQLLIY